MGSDQELQAMEGLKPVKESVEQIIKLVVQNAKREEREESVVDVVLNRVFVGNPGTGKTTGKHYILTQCIYIQPVDEQGIRSIFRLFLY